MIDTQTLADIRVEFYSGPDHETLIIPPNETESFWEWFRQSSIRFNELYSDALPFNTHEFIAGRCFGNSQTVAFNHDVDYYEGFVRRKGEYILHAFNLAKGCVLDVTALSNPEHFLDFDGDPTTNYIGLHIPTALINQINLTDIEAGVLNIHHLLYRFFEAGNLQQTDK